MPEQPAPYGPKSPDEMEVRARIEAMAEQVVDLLASAGLSVAQGVIVLDRARQIVSLSPIHPARRSDA